MRYATAALLLGGCAIEERLRLDVPEVVTLRGFVAHLARTLVHVDGEGEFVVDL
jgi:hypothetical protein